MLLLTRTMWPWSALTADIDFHCARLCLCSLLFFLVWACYRDKVVPVNEASCNASSLQIIASGPFGGISLIRDVTEHQRCSVTVQVACEKHSTVKNYSTVPHFLVFCLKNWVQEFTETWKQTWKSSVEGFDSSGKAFHKVQGCVHGNFLKLLLEEHLWGQTLVLDK